MQFYSSALLENHTAFTLWVFTFYKQKQTNTHLINNLACLPISPSLIRFGFCLNGFLFCGFILCWICLVYNFMCEKHMSREAARKSQNRMTNRSRISQLNRQNFKSFE